MIPFLTIRDPIPDCDKNIIPFRTILYPVGITIWVKIGYNYPCLS